jgi:hypothetical protein
LWPVPFPSNLRQQRQQSVTGPTALYGESIEHSELG